MYILLTVLIIALTCESLVDILGTLGFLVFAITAIFLSCIVENKRKVGFKCQQYVSNRYVRN